MKAEHLVPLEGGWSLWRRFALRGAGFPVREVLKLALPEAPQEVDRLLAAEAHLAAIRSDAVRAIDEGANAKRLGGAWGKRAHKLLGRLSAGQAIALDGLPADLAPAVARLAQAAARVEGARAAARRTWDADSTSAREVTRRLAADERFREAIAWQNRTALVSGLDWLLRQPGGATGWLARKNERLVASYLQRYCTKADTIGFFGPCSWGRIADQGGFDVAPGPALLAARTVYFEHWAIDALAQRLAARPGMGPWLAPRRRSTVRLEGATARLEDGRAIALPEEAARLLAASAGESSARTLLAELGLPEARGLPLLAELCAQGLIHWTFEVPVGELHPEAALAESLRSIGDPALRASATAALDELLACRDAVARAAGRSVELEAALAAADRTFCRLTESAAQRNPGETYAGRTILYEDCRRDLAITLGPALIEPLRAPLALVLTSARWFMCTLVARLRDALGEVYARLAAGSQPVEYVAFLRAAQPLFVGWVLGSPHAIASAVVRELQARWATLLSPDPGARELRLHARDLAPKVRAAFATAEAGSPLLGYLCPDLMIAADSAEAIADGRFRFVLSELHCGMHTFVSPTFLAASDEPDQVVRDWQTDVGRPLFRPIRNKDMHLRGALTTFGAGDFHFEIGDARSHLPRRQILAAGDLSVRREDGGLWICHPDGRRFDAIDFHWLNVATVAAGLFHMLPPERHSPRVVIDDLVVSRERWCLEPAAIPFSGVKDPFERFVAARRFAADHGLPRFVFVKVPEEPKPIFVDFDSAAYIDLFAHVVRRASKITLSEMLAAPSHSWLADRGGNRYVCELRLAALETEA
jgi:hypothetical protein